MKISNLVFLSQIFFLILSGAAGVPAAAEQTATPAANGATTPPVAASQSSSKAIRVERFQGQAKMDGKIVYTEDHVVTFDVASDQALEATTEYRNPKGKLMARLNSDFRPSASLPNHVFEDFRTGNVYGIRRSEGKIILYQQEKGQKEKTKELKEDVGGDRLQVGCQGFNYYLKGRVDKIEKEKIIPVVFMIPGDLTTYHFLLEFQKENADGTVEFVVKIQSWILRLVAPELHFRYDKRINRIVWYKGLSNVKNDKGKLMDVTINYKY